MRYITYISSLLALVFLTSTGMTLAQNKVVVIPLGGEDTPKSKTVFITTETYQGDLNGPAGADALCQNEADADGSRATGIYKAWLGTGLAPQLTSGRSFNKSYLPYVRVDGAIVANNFFDLVDGSPLSSPINVSAQGITLPGKLNAWTDTSRTGVLVASTPTFPSCTWWTVTIGDGDFGFAETTDRWSNEDNNSCALKMHLYCFEQ